MAMPKVVVFGGSGFVGTSICDRLTQLGYANVIPAREKERVLSIESNPLSQALIVTDLSEKEIDAVMQTISPEDVVMNLVGILHASPGEPYGPEFKQAHVDLPERIMQSMKKYGVKRYLHMSALGADPHGPSMYLRSKGVAEILVKKSRLDWTIFRPSVVFGKNDSFINMFGKLQQFFPMMPLAGSANLFQPVAVQDVALAFVEAIQMPITCHQSYDLAGPEVLTLAEIIQFAAKKQGVKRPILRLPDWMGYLQALVLEKMPGKKIMSRDNVASMKVPSVLSAGQANALLEVFGIEPTRLESLL